MLVREKKTSKTHQRGFYFGSTLVGDPKGTANNSNTGKQMRVRTQAHRGGQVPEKAEAFQPG